MNPFAEEIWTPVKGFEEEYEVSNYGRLMSHVVRGRGGIDPNKRTIRQIHNKKGDYLKYVLTGRNKKKTVLMHRLVYEHFVGNIPTKYEIHHLDGNKQNNMVDNLECVSRKEHCLLTIAANENVLKGMNNYNKFVRPKPIHMYDINGNYLATFRNSHIASELTGICQRNILQVANMVEYKDGKTRKQAGGYIWKFKKEYDDEADNS